MVMGSYCASSCIDWSPFSVSRPCRWNKSHSLASMVYDIAKILMDTDQCRNIIACMGSLDQDSTLEVRTTPVPAAGGGRFGPRDECERGAAA